MPIHKKKTILIVEDEKSLRAAMVDIFLAKNFNTIEAKNGREGVDIALNQHPDLIVLDLIMPEMDGIITLNKIREDVWGRTVPIIILTNLSATSGPTTTEIIPHALTYYLIKSDWKLHDIVRKIEGILTIK